MDGPKILKNSI